MEVAFVVCRFLHFTAAMVVFGIGIFQWMLAPPVLANSLAVPIGRLQSAAVLTAVVTAVLWLLLTSGEMGEGWVDILNPATIAAVLVDTEFGRVWQRHLAISVLLLATTVLGSRSPWRFGTLLSALLLGNLAFVGHAIMETGVSGWVSRVSHVFHLLSAGFWFGSLIPLAAALKWLDDPKFGSDAALALRRFSGFGHIAVAIVLVSGVVNTSRVLGTVPLHFASSYQVVLFAKIVAVAIMVAQALVNRYVLMPRLEAGRKFQHYLQMNTFAEIATGVVVLSLVSMLGLLPPA